jgi:hypothetical protein
MKFRGESFVIDLDAAREGLRTKIGLVGLTLPEAKSCAVFLIALTMRHSPAQSVILKG